MSPRQRVAAEPATAVVAAGAPVPNLAAAWYAAMPARRLGDRPLALELFGRPLVAWREGAGRPVVMSRFCPHQGASLALGKVLGGSLRCPFHHWRFDGTGACVDVPGAARIPTTARILGVYPVAERHGFVWVWYGTPEPAYDVPSFPPLEGDGWGYRRYNFTYRTPAPPRRILENAFDPAHFRFVHGIPTDGQPVLRWLTDPADAAENGTPPPRAAWAGARLEVPLRLPGLSAGRTVTLLVDGWPGGQRLTFLYKGRPLAKELLAITPVRLGHTVFQGWSMVRRSRGPLGSAVAFWMYRNQHWLGTRQDLEIYRDVVATDGSVNEPQDEGVLRYRRYYWEWVERAQGAA